MADDEAKARGNAAFSSGDFTSAVLHYNSAISLSPTNHILYSNRSAAHASLRNYADALSDAEKTVVLKPDWAKGYGRLGAARFGLNRFEEAVAAYTKGLRIDPRNEALRSGLADAQASAKKKKEMKQRAKKEIKLGNDAHKEGDFETAIRHYSRAMEMDYENISYIANRAALYLQMEKYKECIEDCDKVVERGRELGSDDKNKIVVARTLTRKGTAFVKMAKCSKDYEPAIEAYQRALEVHRNAETVSKLNEAERVKKECERVEYIDPEICDEQREKGDEFLKEKKYPEAIKQYTEAIKRNPEDPKAYCNRAACYNKLGAIADGLADAEKCIDIDPKFSGGYIRKAEVEFRLKECDTAMKTYVEGLKHDPKNKELLGGVSSCVQEINKANRGGLTPEKLKERLAKGMEDPEIQNILTDPVIRQVMSDLVENTSAAQKQMQNPVIESKIQKLISAGIVQME
ncbi:Hsp70-Hsp90 organizing protein 1 [Raphanus sativus]|uniref:Hsp70-Hsp90 organizing protein 3 n=1 Tax=Raphanus sativus TaxID=3726 RepID=A0A6J0NP69_RAPSA|nr:hsp70-Hsp90 organizing protein 3 [Raphanus sativus]KAJ4896810.1 Hsp70-Hsp90 organizing protein 1 [Raphanus sativus]